MPEIRLTIRYRDFEAEECISIKDELEELLRRVKMKNSPCPTGEVAHQVANEVSLEIVDRHTIRELIQSIVNELSQE